MSETTTPSNGIAELITVRHGVDLPHFSVLAQVLVAEVAKITRNRRVAGVTVGSLGCSCAEAGKGYAARSTAAKSGHTAAANRSNGQTAPAS